MHAPFNQRATDVGSLKNFSIERRENANSATDSMNLSIWHRRLGHPSRDRLQKEISIYKPINHLHGRQSIAESCQGCVYGKSQRQPIDMSRTATRADEIMHTIHTDIWGNAPIPTYQGMQYYVSFTDDKFRYSEIHLPREKSSHAGFEKFEEFKARMETLTGKKITILRSDNGKEYFGPFTNRLKSWGIQAQVTNVYTLSQNGVAERLNRTLVESARSMMYDGIEKRDRKLWGEAVMTSNYLRNGLPSRAIDMKTPYEVFLGKPAKIDHLRVWGCKVAIHVPEETRKTLDRKGYYGMFVG